MWKLLTQVFGSRNQRIIKDMQRSVAAVSALEESVKALSDEQFPQKTQELKAKFAAGTPLAILGGIGRAARAGAIVKGGLFLEQLGKVDTVVLDKTGTLTFGRPKVHTLLPAAGVELSGTRSGASGAGGFADMV